MDTTTTIFLIIGGVGILLLVLNLLGLDFLDFLPMEALAAGLGGFGFSAAIARTLWDSGTGVALAGTLAIGAAAALPAAWLAVRLSANVRELTTDATPAREDLLGTLAVVVTSIPADGYGEVRVTRGGQPVKLNAQADRPVALGTEVFVIAAPSETSVHVEPVPMSPPPT